MTVYNNILGTLVGASFWTFKYNEQPVRYSELKDKRSRAKALGRIKQFCTPENYKAGSLTMTVNDIIDDHTIEDELLIEVLLTLPADQGPGLMHGLEQKRGDKHNELTKRIMKNPEVLKYFKDILNGN